MSLPRLCVLLLTVWAACITGPSVKEETLLFPQVKSLPGNVRPVNCYLNPPTETVGPYLLVKFQGAALDLNAATFFCAGSVVVTRTCPVGSRLRYMAHNGYFGNVAGGDPAKPTDRNLEVWHQTFAGDETFDVTAPLVQLYFWCEARGIIFDANDPELYDPAQPSDNT